MRVPCSSSARSIAAVGNRAVRLVAFELDQRAGRIEAVKANLRLDRVAIGRKRVLLDQDRAAARASGR